MAKMIYRVTSTTGTPGMVLEVAPSCVDNRENAAWTHRSATRYVNSAARRAKAGTVHAILRQRDGSKAGWQTVSTHTTQPDGTVEYVNEILRGGLALAL